MYGQTVTSVEGKTVCPRIWEMQYVQVFTRGGERDPLFRELKPG